MVKQIQRWSLFCYLESEEREREIGGKSMYVYDNINPSYILECEFD